MVDRERARTGLLGTAPFLDTDRFCPPDNTAATDPAAIRDVVSYIPAYDSSTGRNGSIQINDVYVDDRSLVYILDRFGDGITILRSPLIDCKTGVFHP